MHTVIHWFLTRHLGVGVHLQKHRSCLLIGQILWVGFLGINPNSAYGQINEFQQSDRSQRIGMPFLESRDAANRLISLDLNRVDIRIFIKTVGQLTGINFLVDENIEGTVTLISPTKVRVGDVYDIFESVLHTRGYAAVPAGKIAKILPLAQAARTNLPLEIGYNPDTIAINDSLVTQIIPLRFIDVSQVSPIVTALISSGGQTTALPESNTLLVTDTSANIYRVARILQEIDLEGPGEVIELIRLKYASAQRMADQITQIVERLQTRKSVLKSIVVAQDASKEKIKILADERINALVVMGSPDDMEMIRELVAKLDIESPLEAGYVHVIKLEHAEAVELEKSISAALGRITAIGGREGRESFQIIADESTNSLIVVAPPQDYKIVENMVAQLDIPREQVLVQFKIIEASTNVLKELGIDWATLDQAMADSVRGFAATSFGPRIEAAAGDLEGFSVGVYQQVGDQTKIGAILKALERSSGVNVLSTPSILTSNHQEATIVIGDNVPYVRQSRVSEFDPATPTAIRTFDFKDVGVELKVTPHVSAGGLVRMEIEASFSKLIEGATGLSNETPTTAQRKITTTISIMSGTTVVIGGLIRDDTETVVEKVPLLGDIPLLGVLFRADRKRVEKTNLLLFITPKVLSDRESLMQMTERMKQERLNALQSHAHMSPAD